MKLNTLQHPLKVKEKFKTIIRNQTCGKPSTFVIVNYQPKPDADSEQRVQDHQVHDNP